MAQERQPRNLPTTVEIVEVGPRDGLQNESGFVPTEHKARFIDLLAESGLRRIEVTSFVHPKAVPQLADAAELVAALKRHPNVRYSALVPNLKGMERALAAGIREIAVFTGATDSFTKHNINMTVAESIGAFRPVLSLAHQHDVTVRGYVSVCFGCPYEGAVSPVAVLDVCQRLLDLGVHELSIGDTIGVATPSQVPEVVSPIIERAGPHRIALHFHDTYGSALANVRAALELGVRIFVSSAGGLGGCPYAPGSPGNLGTEQLLSLLHGLGIHTGVDPTKVARATAFTRAVLSAAAESATSPGS